CQGCMAPRSSHDAWSAVWERATASRTSPPAPAQATSWSGSGLTSASRQARRCSVTCSPRTPMLYVLVTGCLGTLEAPFHGIHMDFTQAVAIVISSELTPPMVHMLMLVSPSLQTSINAILVRINTCPWNDGVFDEGLDGLLPHIGQQLDHYLT